MKIGQSPGNFHTNFYNAIHGEATGRWRCDPIQQCIYEGVTYKVGSHFLAEPNSKFNYRRSCECRKDRRVYCQPINENPQSVATLQGWEISLIQLATKTKEELCLLTNNCLLFISIY